MPADGEERLRRAIEASDLGLWDYDIATGTLTWSERELALYGLPPGTPVNFDSFVNGVHPDDRELVVSSYTRALDPAGDGRFGFEHRTVAPDGTVRWLLSAGQVYFDEHRRPVSVHGTSRDISPRKQAEIALQESEQLFRDLAESLPHVVWIMRPDGYATYLNRRFKEYHGVEIGGELDERASTIHPEDKPTAWRIREPAVAAGLPFGTEVRLRRFDGVYRWFRMSAVPLRRGGEVFAYVGVGIDVDDLRSTQEELKRALSQQELLINELNHRVKNTLAVVQSIAGQTLRSGQSDIEARRAFDARLLALSAAYDVLTRENWESVDVHTIATAAIEPFADKGEGRFDVGGPSVRVPPNLALPLGMALHELATNAVKYGSLSNAEGTVSIRWEFAGDPQDLRLQLCWQESGGPAVVPRTRKGFGSHLLERSLKQALDGGVDLSFRPEGVVCTLRLPLGG
ncbi:MAG TPA: HWE histidine kinase domain-containing protein [Xanthobacteraceae bacterium]|nr:HWE histidine kinase domain-containing protein [Xanthobacteraceae bacterium]